MLGYFNFKRQPLKANNALVLPILPNILSDFVALYQEISYNYFDISILKESEFMKANAFLFDKDGTLLDFDAFWIDVSIKALSETLSFFKMQNISIDKLIEKLGVYNGVADINGILCKGTYAQIGKATYDYLCKYGCESTCEEVTNIIVAAYNKYSDFGEVKPTCQNMAQILIELKKRNKKIALVTTDNKEITYKCLEKLGIADIFDEIYTDDGHMPVKPDPHCAIDFCKKFNIECENLIMVGDTMTDIDFAKNAGIPVIILSKDEKSKAALSPYANKIITNLSDLLPLIE